MKKIPPTLAAIVSLAVAVGVAARDDMTKEKLIGTWENTSARIPAGFRQIKLITPTHFTWVVYSRGEKKPAAVAGGTWTLQNGVYKEKVDFASDGFEHLRGKEFTFSAKIEDGRLHIKNGPDANFEVDEVWKKAE